MRVLVCAIFDAPRAEHYMGDSCYLWTRFMVEAASKRGWHTTWVVPDVCDPAPLPGVKVVKFSFPEGVSRTNLFQHHLVMARIQQEFTGAAGERFVDAVICNDASLALMLKDYFGARRFFEHTPVLHWHGYPTIKDWSETNWVFQGDDLPLHNRAMGYALADFVSCCPYCTGRIYELVNAYCHPALVKRFIETRSEVMMCADTEMLDSLPAEKFERFSMYWGGRFTSTKGGEGSLQQYIRFVMAGREADIYITAIGGAKRLDETLKHYGAKDLVKVFRGLPYDQAQTIMKRCHVSIFNQLNPGAAAPYEQMYAGLVVMFKRHHYPEEDLMYPPGYPFLFNTDEEGATMLRWIHENYDKAVFELERVGVKQWVRDRTDKQIGADKILELAASRIPESSFGKSRYKWFQDLQDTALKALEALQAPVPFPLLLDGIDRLKGHAIVQRIWGTGVKGIPPLSIYRAFIPPGWKDDCETDIVRLVRDDG